MSHADNATHGSKGISAIKPANPVQADNNMSCYHENCRREREGLPIMTKAEADDFLKPRINRQGSTAVEFAGG